MASRRDSLMLERGRDAWCAFGAGAIALAAYLLTLPPSYAMWDTAELQTVPAILGIAHPPGSPAFTLLGWLVVRAFPFGEAATRVNVMCACAAAISVALAYAAARRIGAQRVASFVAALAFGLTLVTWRDATRAEVQDVALCARVAALYFGIRWYADGTRCDLFAAWLAAGLACATHGLSLFVLPSLVLLTIGRAGWKRGVPVMASAGGFALGLLPYAYLPLRSAWVDAHHLDPMIALGLPAGLPFWNYGDPSSVPAFVHFVTGADFHVRGGFAGYITLSGYPYYAAAVGRQISAAYGYVGTMLALGGAIVLACSRRRLDRIAVVVAGVLPLPYIVAYPDVQDRERYYLIVLWCAAVAMALAFDRLAALFALRAASIGRALFAGAFALSFATVGAERLDLIEQRRDLTGPDYVSQVLQFTQDDAIVLADWSYATPLAYAGYVDHAIGRRSVVASSASQYLSYAARWVRTRPVYFVGFDDDLKVPGWHVRRVHSGSYYAYRLTK